MYTSSFVIFLAIPLNYWGWNFGMVVSPSSKQMKDQSETMMETWHCWHCAWFHLFFDVCDIVWLDGCITGVSAPNIVEGSSANFFNSPTELCPGITTMDWYETIRRESHSDFALPTLNSSVKFSPKFMLHTKHRSLISSNTNLSTTMQPGHYCEGIDICQARAPFFVVTQPF